MPQHIPVPAGILDDVAELCDGLADIALYQMRVTPDHRAVYTYVSAGVVGMLGWTAEQLLQDAAYFDQNLDPNDRVKLRLDLARGGGPHTHTVCHRCADGSPRWIKVRFRGRPQPDGSQIVTGVAEDVTEVALIEAAMRVSDERFRAFMNQTPPISWMKNETGHYVFLNERFQTIFGIQLADWVGRTDAELYPVALAQEFRQSDLTVLAEDRPQLSVETGPPVGEVAETRWWVLKFPFRGPDGVRYVGGIGLDLTDREQLHEELRRANEELKASQDKVRRLESIVTMCAWTRRMRLGDRWVSIEEFLRDRLGMQVSHGISDEALADLEEELRNNPWRH